MISWRWPNILVGEVIVSALRRWTSGTLRVGAEISRNLDTRQWVHQVGRQSLVDVDWPHRFYKKIVSTCPKGFSRW